ncbi:MULTISPECIES: lipopolysaccharide transport periplasmic protein LptA [unclassified Halomonas]|uniref:lipopolysaccharide transport periplasmic protein LptA n=1 Tax=unclassified Halomonas TaxID=2609666 RepID=UPI001CF1AF61|nr:MULTISPECIES: lipopolysaccharide transport periplasmic protein LptA [unclassified Halomonas]MCA8865009.1 lipopolysaccharide transport periplasmic protein LptA [Halomonas sp. SBBP1]UZH11717.1 lipopolysaccharide transport periplasmic protein LptA [Halomonas sp. BDJS001]
MKALVYTAFFALAIPLTAQAQTSQQAPIEVEADRLDLDQRAGTAVYSGDVDIRQGEMQLRGERVEVKRNEAGELSTATATGERAYLRHQGEGQEGPTEGWARRIIYHVAERRVELIDQAELTQQEDTFNGGRLEYFIDREVIQARSDVDGSEPQRIRMTLQPEQ